MYHTIKSVSDFLQTYGYTIRKASGSQYVISRIGERTACYYVDGVRNVMDHPKTYELVIAKMREIVANTVCPRCNTPVSGITVHDGWKLSNAVHWTSPDDTSEEDIKRREKIMMDSRLHCVSNIHTTIEKQVVCQCGLYIADVDFTPFSVEVLQGKRSVITDTRLHMVDEEHCVAYNIWFDAYGHLARFDYQTTIRYSASARSMVDYWTTISKLNTIRTFG